MSDKIKIGKVPPFDKETLRRIASIACNQLERIKGIEGKLPAGDEAALNTCIDILFAVQMGTL